MGGNRTTPKREGERSFVGDVLTEEEKGDVTSEGMATVTGEGLFSFRGGVPESGVPAEGGTIEWVAPNDASLEEEREPAHTRS